MFRPFRLIFAILLTLPAIAHASPQRGWTHPEAKYRVPVYIDASQLPTDVDGFPVFVRLSAQSSDLRPTDGVLVEDARSGRTLDSRVDWSADGKVAIVEVMVPKLQARSVDGMLWVYYGGIAPRPNMVGDGHTSLIRFTGSADGGVAAVSGSAAVVDGAATIVDDGVAGSSLRLKGRGVVKIAFPKDIPASSSGKWTIEAVGFDESGEASMLSGRGLVSVWAKSNSKEPLINFGKVGYVMHSDSRRGPDGMWTGATNAGKALPWRWIHYAAVYDLDAGRVTTYLNGRKVGEGAAPNQLLPMEELRIGGWAPGAFAWNGRIDAVRIHNVARSDAYLTAAARTLRPDGRMAIAGAQEERDKPAPAHIDSLPVCMEPDSAGIVDSVNPRLVWSMTPGTKSYTVQISRNADMTSPLRAIKTGARPGVVCDSGLPTSTRLYWRVTAGDGRWSQVSSFTICAAEQEARKVDMGPLHPIVPKVARVLEPGLVDAFRPGGVVGDRVNAALENWALRVPDDNPDLTGMFRDQWHTEGFLPFWGESFGKFYQGASLLYRMTGDKRLRGLLDREIAKAISYQEPSGYMGAYTRERRLFGPGPSSSNWDLYNGHHALMALLEYHEATGDEKALRAAMRMADLWCSVFGPGRKSIIKDIPGPDQCNLGVIAPLTWLYRLTGRERYLELSKFVVKEIEANYGPRWLTQAQDGKHCSEMPGNHALEQLFVFEGITDLYRITGDTRLRDTMVHWWEDMTARERMAHGNLACEELWMNRPFSPSWAETCVTTAYIRFTLQVFYTTADPKCADMMEEAMLNAYLGAQRPDGALWAYPVPVNGTKLYGVYTLKPEDPDLGCCFTYALTGMGLMTRWATMAEDGKSPALVINYYGQGKSSAVVNGNRVDVAQATAYPRDPDVAMTIAPAKAGVFDVKLRIPYWSKETIVSVNGGKAIRPTAGEYLTIHRKWSPGDKVSVRFDFTPRVVQGSGETQGRVAVYRGPLLLTMDERFNPGYDPAKSPLDVSNLTLKQTSSTVSGPQPWVLMQTPTVDGGVVTLCDFASAGALGERYEGWVAAR